MRRKIPSTMALAAFEAAARHQSFTLAADELALTQSAIGRQIANLEGFVGVKMFRRTRRGVALTAAGEQYSRTIRARLDDVERDTLAVMSSGGTGGSIELAVVPTFATHWLIPRIRSFHEQHPGFQVNLHAQTRPFLFNETRMDAAIHASSGGWPGTRADLLMPEPMSVVCAPSLLGKSAKLTAKAAARLPLIQMTTRPYAWREWFMAQGMDVETDMAGTRVELFSMAIQSAVHGEGAALVPTFFAVDEVRRGLLAVAAAQPFTSSLGYYLIHPERDPLQGGMALFRDWLLEQSSAYLAEKNP